MNKIRIVVDSCSDLDKDFRDRYGIAWAKNYIRYEDGREFAADLNWEEDSPKELYDYMRAKNRIITSQVSVKEFERVFTECVERGEDVLYLGCSSALSGSVNSARIAKTSVEEKYGGARIEIVDTLRASLANALIVIDAAEYLKEGKTLDEAVEHVENNKLDFHMIGTVDTLDYLKRAGRVKASAAFFGNLFGVKPIIIADANGNNFAVKKVRGRNSAMKEMVDMLAESVTDAGNQTVFIGHADCIDDAEFLKEEVIKTIAPKDVYIGYIGPCVGSSTGPGMVSLFAKGKKVEVSGN